MEKTIKALRDLLSEIVIQGEEIKGLFPRFARVDADRFIVIVSEIRDNMSPESFAFGDLLDLVEIVDRFKETMMVTAQRATELDKLGKAPYFGLSDLLRKIRALAQQLAQEYCQACQKR